MNRKSAVLIFLIAGMLLGMIALCVHSNQKMFIGNQVKSRNCYILEFEKMNQKDSHVLSACKDDVFTVNFRIDNGHADFIIAMDGKTPIYKGNDIESGVFDVIVPEGGEYRITINARHADGFLEVYAKK